MSRKAAVSFIFQKHTFGPVSEGKIRFRSVKNGIELDQIMFALTKLLRADSNSQTVTKLVETVSKRLLFVYDSVSGHGNQKTLK